MTSENSKALSDVVSPGELNRECLRLVNGPAQSKSNGIPETPLQHLPLM